MRATGKIGQKPVNSDTARKIIDRSTNFYLLFTKSL